MSRQAPPQKPDFPAASRPAPPAKAESSGCVKSAPAKADFRPLAHSSPARSQSRQRTSSAHPRRQTPEAVNRPITARSQARQRAASARLRRQMPRVRQQPNHGAVSITSKNLLRSPPGTDAPKHHQPGNLAAAEALAAPKPPPIRVTTNPGDPPRALRSPEPRRRRSLSRPEARQTRRAPSTAPEAPADPEAPPTRRAPSATPEASRSHLPCPPGGQSRRVRMRHRTPCGVCTVSKSSAR